MEHFAEVRITSIQTDGEDSTKSKSIYKGKIFEKKNEIFIYYNEDDLDKTSAIIKISEKTVTVTRRGLYCSKMFFCEGESSTVLYNTPHGTINILLITNKINVKHFENKISVNLFYQLYISGDKTNNEMLIDVIKTNR